LIAPPRQLNRYVASLMNEQTSSSKASVGDRPLSVLHVLIVGWLWVNIPAVTIILGILFIGAFIEFRLWWLFLIIGFFIGWTWWSFTITRWRKWALNRGVPSDQLQKWAVAVGLTWPKGLIFEKTEIRPDE
jgi:hypothetical protein